MFYQISLLIEVKRISIVSNERCIYELPHELQIDFRLRILENYEKSEKSWNLIEL